MHSTIKRMLTLLLCVLLLVSAAVPAAAADGDEVRAAKKIISVVYDDSGSMEGERWDYANYAMQALIALLNEQDDLYITFMSQPQTVHPIDLGNLQKAVDSVRKWEHLANTPEEAIHTAKKQLDQISDPDSSTQYWLAILTDGELNDGEAAIQPVVDQYKGETMGNGSVLNIAYLFMGSGGLPSTRVAGEPQNRVYSYEANDAAITKTMSELANLISGRLPADKLDQVSDNAVTFSSSLPLYSISVLSQQSKATLTDAKTQEERLSVDRNITLSTDGTVFGSDQLNLFGDAAVVTKSAAGGNREVIPAGTYTLTFSEKVSASNLTVQYEPAIALKASITRGGVAIDDPSQLADGDVVDISITPVVPGTDDPIDKADLPANAQWSIEYEVDGTIRDSGDGMTLSNVQLQQGDSIIRGIMRLPGYAPVSYEIRFDLTQPPLNLGIDVQQPDDVRYSRRNPSSSLSGEEVVFWITNDGARLTKEELEQLDLHLNLDDVSCDNSAVEGFLNRFGWVESDGRLIANDDGSFTLRPRFSGLAAFLIKAGDYTVRVSASRDAAIHADGRFTVAAQLADWAAGIWWLLGLLLLIHLIYVLFFKKRFQGQTLYFDVYKQLSDGHGHNESSEVTTLNPLGGHAFLPFRDAAYLDWEGMRFVAGEGGTVYISGKSIEGIQAYVASPVDPKRRLNVIIRSMRQVAPARAGQEKKPSQPVADIVLNQSMPLYILPNAGSKKVWRIHLQ